LPCSKFTTEDLHNYRELTFQDIGGGWPLDPGDDSALSHVPLVWMIREAEKAGLEFDDEKLEALHCWYDETEYLASQHQTNVPTIEIDPGSPPPTSDHNGANGATNGTVHKNYVDEENFASHHHTHPDTLFHKHFHFAATKGRIHDVLQFKNGATAASVVSWNIMEYMPFRRMDLREDGTWKAIIWPLPKGETRDIPANAVIHSSVIKRMLADPTYRPGNLIVGGGGRGVRRAPKDLGIGKWVVLCEDGHPVGELLTRKEPPKRTKTDESMTMPAGAMGMQGNYFAGRKSSRVV
jgi:hypothetical protein